MYFSLFNLGKNLPRYVGILYQSNQAMYLTSLDYFTTCYCLCFNTKKFVHYTKTPGFDPTIYIDLRKYEYECIQRLLRGSICNKKV